MELPIIVILLLAVLCVSLQGANADCTLEFEFPTPQMLINFGSKHLLKRVQTVKGQLSETVELYCANGFKAYRSYRNEYVDYSENSLKLECSEHGFTTDMSDTVSYTVSKINCVNTQVSQLYQSQTHMPDCDSYMSLVVGQNFENIGTLKYLAICYDLTKQRIKYVSYTAYPPKTKVIEKTQEGQLNRLGLDIEVTSFGSIFNTLGVTVVTDALRNNILLNALVGENTFEYDNLIQDRTFTRDISGYAEILNIVWLRGLRTGNWRHLLNALQIASLDAKYDVRVGVSGTVTLPVFEQYNETRPLILELDTGDSLTVPTYIWAHIRALQPVENSTDEFVVVAHNSPFVTKDEAEELCANMCHEVTWLKNSLFTKLQYYPVNGLVQCCRVSDVEHKLANFPKPTRDTEIGPVDNIKSSSTMEPPPLKLLNIL